MLLHAHHTVRREVGHLAIVSIGRDAIQIDYTITLTKLDWIAELGEMNVDGDSQVTDEERETFLAQVALDLKRNLTVHLDGTPAILEVEGQARLSEERYRKSYTYRVSLEEPLSTGEHGLSFHDGNYPDVPAIVRVTAKSGPGIGVVTVGQQTDSAAEEDALLDPWSAPERVEHRGATIRFECLGPAAAEGDTPQGISVPPSAAGDDGKVATREARGGHVGYVEQLEARVEQLLRGGENEPWIFFVALSVAFLLGALHALSPGHGKTLVAAYLVGSRGTVWHAVFLGMVVTLTHTSSVIVLGVVLRGLVGNDPGRITPWLTCGCGLLISGMGVSLLIARIKGKHGHSHGPFDGDHHQRHGHEAPHEHEHPHGHAHEPEQPGGVSAEGRVRPWELFSLGVTGGLVPCPEAFVILLIAVAMSRIMLGLLVIVAMSLGLASVLIVIGILMVKAKDLVARSSGRRAAGLARILPLVSALLVTALGILFLGRGLVGIGVL